MASHDRLTAALADRYRLEFEVGRTVSAPARPPRLGLPTPSGLIKAIRHFRSR